MNVIVVVCNGLHLGFLGAYGNSWIETPNLDRLATEGVVFDHHFPENLTTIPTRRSWWTGRYGFPDPDSGWTALRADEDILPDLLWDQGVRSALISDVPLLRDATQGFGRGWDDVVWVRGQGYDPLVPPTDPRVGKVRISDEPGLRLPDKDDPDRDLWKGRWEQFLRNRAVLKTENRGKHRHCADRQGCDRLARPEARRSFAVPALARPVQPAWALGTPPSRIETSTPPPSPTSSKRARKGISSRTTTR